MNSSSVTTLKIMPKISSLISNDQRLSIAAVKLKDDFIIAKRSTIELWWRFKIAEILESESASLLASLDGAPLPFEGLFLGQKYIKSWSGKKIIFL